MGRGGIALLTLFHYVDSERSHCQSVLHTTQLWRCKQHMGGSAVGIILMTTVLQTAQHVLHQSMI